MKADAPNQQQRVVVTAVEMFLKKGFGDNDIISWLWLKDALCLVEAKTIEEVAGAQFDMLQKVEMFKDELLTRHQIALKNVRGVGYMIIPPGEQAYHAAEVGIKVINSGMRKAERLLENVRLSEMDNTEKQRHTDAQVKFAALKGLMNKERIDVFAIFKDTKRIE